MQKTTIVLLLVLWLAARSSVLGSDPPPYEQWGNETLATIRKDLWLPKLHLYAEQAPDERGAPAHPSFMWGVGVQLSALAAASAVEPQKYLAQTHDYADAIQVYWTDHDGREGFDVLPRPNDPDRYYDDNAWLVLALADVFEVTRERKYLDRAAATFRFVTSCEDDKLGGGLYWRESFSPPRTPAPTRQPSSARFVSSNSPQNPSIWKPRSVCTPGSTRTCRIAMDCIGTTSGSTEISAARNTRTTRR